MSLHKKQSETNKAVPPWVIKKPTDEVIQNSQKIHTATCVCADLRMSWHMADLQDWHADQGI